MPCLRDLAELDASEATWPAFIDSLVVGVARSSTLTSFLDLAVDRGLLGAESGPRTEMAAARAADLVDALKHALFLSRVTRCIVESDDLSATRQLCDHQRAHERRLGNWRARLSLFELAKFDTMAMALDRLASAREARSIAPNFGHVGLPANILEAALADACAMRWSNARAACALAAAAPGAALRGYWPRDGGASRALSAPARIDAAPCATSHVYPPLCAEWVDLYVGWNACFVSAEYCDAPHFLAQVLAPALLNAPPSEFVLRRSIALSVHISHTVTQRAHASLRGALPLVLGDETRPCCSWRSARLLRAWGEHNAAAGARYEALLASARARSFDAHSFGNAAAREVETLAERAACDTVP
jgi:hypothetical protein